MIFRLTVKLMIVEVEPKDNYILYAKYGLKIYLKKYIQIKKLRLRISDLQRFTGYND